MGVSQHKHIVILIINVDCETKWKIVAIWQHYPWHFFFALWDILEGDGSLSMLSGGAQGILGCMCPGLNRYKGITGFQLPLNRHRITAGPPFWPESISLSQCFYFKIGILAICNLFSCWKQVIGVALVPGFFILEFAHQLFKLNTLLKTQSWPLQGETSTQWSQQKHDNWWLTLKITCSLSSSGKTSNLNLHLSGDPNRWS